METYAPPITAFLAGAGWRIRTGGTSYGRDSIHVFEDAGRGACAH